MVDQAQSPTRTSGRGWFWAIVGGVTVFAVSRAFRDEDPALPRGDFGSDLDDAIDQKRTELARLEAAKEALGR